MRRPTISTESGTCTRGKVCRHSATAAVAVLVIFSASVAQSETEFTTGSSDPLIQFINQQIRSTWEDNEVKPSPVATDEEWLRRVYLDIVGRIPTAEEVDTFLDDESDAKRSAKIDELLAHPDYVRNLTEVWTNTLIGRVTPDGTSRSGMRKFLRESFARNRPWNEIVYELVTAEGHFEENGAVNFILAQLQGNPNDPEYHVEATAKVTKVLLGMQVQCTQCHDHPFNDWKQNQFWEFNSFLQQAWRVDHQKYDAQSGQMVDDYSELTYRDFDGPVFYEMRNGLKKVAYPNYLGKAFEEKGLNRRELLGRQMAYEDDQQTVAKAMVNRMWGHFMGYGFTRPIDDIGPHNTPSHPELMARLSEEFVKSGYDIKQLIRWICNSEPYQLTSQFNSGNDFDNPAAGEVPLFSHMYVKTLSAEQLYDSLLVATNAHKGGAVNFQESEAQRERWLQDYLRIFGGNEGDEPTLFSGSIPQALLMMNGPLVESAISAEPGSYLNTVLSSSRLRSDATRVQALFISALGRVPTGFERNRLGKMMAQHPDKLNAYQDLYWALLNSNEFILNH